MTARDNPDQDQESLRQLNLIYSGLIGIGALWVQPFLTAPSLDLSATVCVVAFSVAIPLPAALVALNWQEVFRRRMARSAPVNVAQVVAQSCAFISVVAGFWHILWVAGLGMLVSGLVAVAVHTTGYWRLERDRLVAPREPEEPGDPEA